MIKIRRGTEDFILRLDAADSEIIAVNDSLSKAVYGLNRYLYDLVYKVVFPFKSIPLFRASCDIDYEDVADRLETAYTRAKSMGFDLMVILKDGASGYTVDFRYNNKAIEEIIYHLRRHAHIDCFELENIKNKTMTLIQYEAMSTWKPKDKFIVILNNGVSRICAESNDLLELEDAMFIKLSKVALDGVGEILKTELHRREA